MMTNEVKNILVMRHDVIELGFKNMDKFGADLFCLVIREIRRNVEKLNRNQCTFEYSELKEILNIDDHMSYRLNEVVINLPPEKEQDRIVSVLDRMDSLCNDISDGIPAEIDSRQKQYEYYRDKLLDFKRL